MGLRELKKQQTRTTLADTAMGLFVAHGFERVTVAEVARAAGVSVNTVFNYFPSKEDLFFERRTEVECRLAEVVRTRPAGTSAAAAVRDAVLADLTALAVLADLPGWQVVADSPALQARGREIAERAEALLAAALAEESGAAPDDPLPRMLAGAIAGVYRAVTAEIRRRVVAGDPVDGIGHSVRAAAQQTFDLLQGGLGDYPR